MVGLPLIATGLLGNPALMAGMLLDLEYTPIVTLTTITVDGFLILDAIWVTWGASRRNFRNNWFCGLVSVLLVIEDTYIELLRVFKFVL